MVQESFACLRIKIGRKVSKIVVRDFGIKGHWSLKAILSNSGVENLTSHRISGLGWGDLPLQYLTNPEVRPRRSRGAVTRPGRPEANRKRKLPFEPLYREYFIPSIHLAPDKSGYPPHAPKSIFCYLYGCECHWVGAAHGD